MSNVKTAMVSQPSPTVLERPLPLNVVAGRLGLTVKTVRRKIKEGKLLAIDVGQGKRPTYRVYPSEVERFLAMGARRQFEVDCGPHID